MLKICIAIVLLCEATRGRWRHFEHLRRSFEAESQNEVGCAHLTRRVEFKNLGGVRGKFIKLRDFTIKDIIVESLQGYIRAEPPQGAE